MAVFVMLYFSSEVDLFDAIASVSVVMEERGEDIVHLLCFCLLCFIIMIFLSIVFRDKERSIV